MCEVKPYCRHTGADRFVPRNDQLDKKVRGSLRGNQRKMHCVKSGSIAEANCI